MLFLFSTALTPAESHFISLLESLLPHANAPINTLATFLHHSFVLFNTSVLQPTNCFSEDKPCASLTFLGPRIKGYRDEVTSVLQVLLGKVSDFSDSKVLLSSSTAKENSRTGKEQPCL